MSGAGRVVSVAAPGVAAFLGMSIPVAPACIAVLSAFLVRAPLLKPSSAGFVSDVAITVLAMLGAFVTVVDHKLAPGMSFWVGIGFGGLGSGLIEIGKTALGGAVTTRLGAAFKVLFGIKE